MELLLPVLLFALGLVLIIKGGDIFVDAASWMARVSGIPPFIVGATVVSLATTLPEIMVSALAAVSGQVDMANGNAIGSVTANTGLILAIAMMAMPAAVRRRDYLLKSLVLIACLSVLLIFSQGGALRRSGSLILFALFLLAMADSIRSGRQAMADTEDGRPDPVKKDILKNLVLFLAGAAFIVAGAKLLVDNGSLLARMLGVPEGIIAVTLVAVGTSLPELVTTITAIAKKQSSLSAGNVIGANIIDCALILPICGLISGQELPVGAQCLGLDLPFCLAIVCTALLPMLLRQRFMRWQGWACLGLYVVYMGFVIL